MMEYDLLTDDGIYSLTDDGIPHPPMMEYTHPPMMEYNHPTEYISWTLSEAEIFFCIFVGAEIIKYNMKGYTYILECSNGAYYTGSTKNLELRLEQHKNGEGANFTKKHLPVKLVYYEEFQRIDTAFYREKQIQGWSRKKKQALINGMTEELKKLSQCMNDSHYKNKK